MRHVFTTAPHAEHEIFEMPNLLEIADVTYDIRQRHGSAPGTVRILGRELRSLCQWHCGVDGEGPEHVIGQLRSVLRWLKEMPDDKCISPVQSMSIINLARSIAGAEANRGH